MIEIFVPGKWVLAGEHTVLRGGAAVALPHPVWGMKVDSLQTAAPEEQLLTDSVARLVGLLCGLEAQEFMRGIRVRSTIPQGGGLGSSAALCVVATRLAGLKDPDEIRKRATELENQFHGKSSGMDVAAVMAAGPIEYQWGLPRPLKPTWDLNAHVSFVDTGERGSTRTAIATVQSNPQSMQTGDDIMRQAVELALQALAPSISLSEGLKLTAQSMERSMEAYRIWGVLSPRIEQKAQELRDQGAKAVRLTGAGLGGFLVALWPRSR